MDLLADSIKKMCDEMNTKREALIIGRLKKLGIELDMKLEKTRRFKSLLMENDGEAQTYYYNDGSENGLRIITFVTNQNPFNHEDMRIKFEVHYY